MTTATSNARVSALLPTPFVEAMKTYAKKQNTSFNALLQQAVEHWWNQQLEQDAKDLSLLSYSDLPTEDEWQEIQSIERV